MFSRDIPPSKQSQTPSTERSPSDQTEIVMPSGADGSVPSSSQPSEVHMPPVTTEERSEPLPTDDISEPPEPPAVTEPVPRETDPMSDEKIQTKWSRFSALPKWEQQQILKMHRNLGHPSNDRLSKALQVAGHRPDVVQAALELRCATCASVAPPKHQRPASLKPLLDFNDKVYLDGIDWVNSQGKSFHIYHFIDAGSNFHVAAASPASTTEALIACLQQFWVSWAGPPNEMIVDSGTEMNSAEFTDFTQRFGIKCNTTCPEAHWQNGKVERHGSFLQDMLTRIDKEYPINNYEELQVNPDDTSSHAGDNTELGNLEEQETINLICHDVEDALAMQSESVHSAWRCEFDVQLPTSLSQEQLNENESWALLATTAKKQRTEVKLTELTAKERAEFEKAKTAEVANWIHTGTINKILRNQIPSDQILRCRWILTWKPIDTVGENVSNVQAKQHEKTNKLPPAHNPTHKPKARLVVLGYLDPQIENIPRDSPTLSKTARMMTLQAIASHGWDARSFDIKAAFLQGQPQSDRVMAIEPVPELRKALQMTPEEVAKLNKGAYGLIDAPYLWYCALVSELLTLGFEVCPFDPCLFLLRSTDETTGKLYLNGMIGVHVDDGICGGDPLFLSKLSSLEQKFPFGSHKISAFTFTGIEVSQQADKSITLNQSAYVRKITSIPIDPNRKTQPELAVTETERLALRGLVGSLQYASTNTRPDLASRLSLLQSEIPKATVGTLQEGNKLLHEAKKNHDVTITIKPIPVEDFRFMAFSDASFASHTCLPPSISSAQEVATVAGGLQQGGEEKSAAFWRLEAGPVDLGSVSSMAATEEAGKLIMGQALHLPTSLVKPYCFRNWQAAEKFQRNLVFYASDLGKPLYRIPPLRKPEWQTVRLLCSVVVDGAEKEAEHFEALMPRRPDHSGE
eukprot:s3886_g7.t1